MTFVIMEAPPPSGCQNEWEKRPEYGNEQSLSEAQATMAHDAGDHERLGAVEFIIFIFPETRRIAKICTTV